MESAEKRPLILPVIAANGERFILAFDDVSSLMRHYHELGKLLDQSLGSGFHVDLELVDPKKV